MPRLPGAFLFFIAILLLPMAAQAGLMYDESVHGDSPAWYRNGGVALGNVSSGDYVLGSMTGGRDHWEGYSFVLDGSVSTITIAATSGVPHNRWQLYSGPGSKSILQDGILNAGNLSQDFSVLGEIGTFRLGNNNVKKSMLYDYRISFNAPAISVPEPGSLSLHRRRFARIRYYLETPPHFLIGLTSTGI